MAKDMGDKGDDIVYNSDGKVGLLYDQAKEKEDLNPTKEKRMDTRKQAGATVVEGG